MKNIDEKTGLFLKNFKTGVLSSNTEIIKRDGFYCVLLFSNCIAKYNGYQLIIDSCGWCSQTTASRLDGICEALGVKARFSRKKGNFYIYGELWDGKEKIFNI